MNFILHTVIFFKNTAVYYNIYKEKSGYYAKVLDNPAGLKEAVDFNVMIYNDRWNIIISLPTDSKDHAATASIYENAARSLATLWKDKDD